MPLEIVYGETRKRQQAVLLAQTLADALTEGTVYLGYPVLTTAEARVDVDALLVTEAHGLVGFLLAEELPKDSASWSPLIDAQDRLFTVLESQLMRHEDLRSRRRLAFDVQTVTVFPSHLPVPAPPDAEGTYLPFADVAAHVLALPSVSPAHHKATQAALQRVTTIKPAKRRSTVKLAKSRGAAMKEIEKNIANLDRWQKRAAIESPEGPQRIRGLAGSGKTVVLALKAAYLHAQYPEWRIALTFHTRALYQQLEDLVTRFSFEHSNDKPDYSRLQIMHSWGGSGRQGVYAAIARHMGEVPRDFNYARGTYGAEGAFAGICAELLKLAEVREFDPLFDAVLIDEAQDLPPEFFRLVYRFTRPPKRIVWAYDELQKLNEAAMPPLEELFGVAADGQPVVNLHAAEGQARRDILLPICYRNTPWAISTAHALGFGIYRKEGGLVQHFDEPQQWREIGYEVRGGSLSPGKRVVLERGSDTYPGYFLDLVTKSDAVVLKDFADELAQDTWVAEAIKTNLGTDELEHDDILIVLPNSQTAKRRSVRLSQTLARSGVESHLVGVASSVDEVFMPGSIAIASIYRAKGNEAPMVYVLDSQYATHPHSAITRRNTLFTAITRSRAWVRICGYGDAMKPLAAEVVSVQDEDYALKFKVPTTAELTRMRRVNRDRSEAEADSVKRATESLEFLLQAFDNGELDIDDLPPRLRTRFMKRMRDSADDDN